jgi:hypothetical protein
MSLNPVIDGNILRFDRDPNGRPIRVVTDIDGLGFTEVWLAVIEAAQVQG